MVLVEDKNNLQEVFPASLTVDSVLGEDLEEITQQGLISTLGHLLVKTLCLLCSGEGLSETGSKKELVERLVGNVLSKAKGKGKPGDVGQDKNVWDGRNITLEDISCG
ncbi:21171_t:CDS:1, partial [Dentiscutata erythropus]